MKLSKVNTIILSLTLLLSIISTVYLYSATPASANSTQPQAAKAAIGNPGVFTGIDPSTWYTTFEGVLAVPNEAPLFPFYHGDVEISVSRFGENINPFAQSQQVNPSNPSQKILGVGFQYMDSNGQPYDPIRNAQVNINNVVDGWKLVVTYNYNNNGQISTRTIWAYALFSDESMAGSPADGAYASDGCPSVQGGWILCPYGTPMPVSATLTPHGGRKTNGFVSTSATPMVLVDTPRRIVVASINTIYDLHGETPSATSCTATDQFCLPVARLTMTFDFNKDTKELIIIKDVKLLLDIKTTNTITEPDCENLGSTLFENSAAAIAGLNYVPRFAGAKSQGAGGPSYACVELLDTEELDQGSAVTGYAHFYDGTLHSADTQTTSKCLTTGFMTGPAPTVFADPLYHWDANRGATNCQYDVMQAIDQAGGLEQHITSKAFWPVPDWFTVDAKNTGQFFTKLEGTTTTDLANAPDVVGTSVQWNFLLNNVNPNPTNPGLDARVAWRSVETLLVTDLNDGEVCQDPSTGVGPTGNSLTTVSTLAQVPPGTATTSLQELTSSTTTSGTTIYFVTTTVTAGVTCFTDNVIDKEEKYFDSMVFVPWDIVQAEAKHFVTFVNYFTMTCSTSPCANTFNTYIPIDVPALGLTAGEHLGFLNVPNDHHGQGSQWTPTGSPIGTGTSGSVPGWDSYGGFGERVLRVTTSGSAGTDSNGDGLTCSTPSCPDTGIPDVGTLLQRRSVGNPTTTNGIPTGTPNLAQYGIAGPAECQLRDNSANSCTGFTVVGNDGDIFKIIFSIDITKRTAFDANPVTGTGTTGGLAAGAFLGSYEWITVGRDSSPADSAAAAMVTEANLGGAFHVLTGLAGFDMKDQIGGASTPTNPTLPFVLQRFVAGSPDAKGDYTECNTAPTGLGSFLPPNGCPEGPRYHLRNDFSTVVPVDGANIMVVGGPNANQVANLANDYLSVIFRGNMVSGAAPDWYSPGAWDELSATGNVFTPSQMDCTPTSSGACTFGLAGSGMISTYMDVDGTVFYVLYGGNAQDTFWTAQYALQYLTSFNYNGGPGFKNAETNGYVYCVGVGTTHQDLINNGQVCTTGLPLQSGVTTVLFNIDYTNPHPPSITIFKMLDTVSEIFPEQDK